MKKLIIKKAGYTLKFHNMELIRTPAEIDITKLNMNMVLNVLHLNCVQDYIIQSTEESMLVKTKNKKIKKSENSEINPENNIEKKIEALSNNIDLIIEHLKQQRPVQISNISEQLNSVKDKLSDDVDTFIPEINFKNNTEIKFNQETTQNEIDDSTIKKLKTLKKGK